MGSCLSWPEIRSSDAYRGRWVSLDECTYDTRTATPTQGVVVDSDEDLVELCSRMQRSDSRHCAILFCDGRRDELPPPSSYQRRTMPSIDDSAMKGRLR